jgi:prepilin-type N-terminal cleavage/methylation domain-containing protein
MKKSFLKAFTLVELIIVISIITITTTSTVFYFLDFVKNQEVKQRTQLISNNLDQLDKDIEKYKIFDYEILFNTSSLS